MRNSLNTVLAMTRRAALVCVNVRYDREFFELLAALPSISFSYSSSGRCDGYFSFISPFITAARFLASPGEKPLL
jgi:hypothetical protein